MMTQTTEVELKYSAPSSDALHTVLAARRLGGFDIGEFEERRITDTYYDTPDHALAAAGYSLRQRQNGERSEITLKALTPPDGGVHRRAEITLHDAESPDPAAWPIGDTRSLVEAIVGDTIPQPLFVIEQVRRVAPLIARDVSVAELSVDEICWRMNEREARDWMVEVELEEGQPEELTAWLDESIDSEWGLKPTSFAKYERGMQLLRANSPGAPSDGEFDPHESVYSFVHRHINQQAAVLAKQEKRLKRRDDPDAVHDARVALRRMRSLLYFLGPWLPRKRTAEVRKQLRRGGRALGAVRDLDVVLEFVEARAPATTNAAHFPLSDYLRAERKAARNDMRAYLNGNARRALKQSINDFLDAPDHASESVGDVLAGLIGPALAELARYDASLGPDAPVEHLHELRIAIKRCRYLLEFTQPDTSPASDVLLRALVAMQDQLGVLHDTDVCYKLAYQLLRDPDIALTTEQSDELLSFGRAVHLERENIRASFPPLWEEWKRVSRPDTVERVLAALA